MLKIAVLARIMRRVWIIGAICLAALIGSVVRYACTSTVGRRCIGSAKKLSGSPGVFSFFQAVPLRL